MMANRHAGSPPLQGGHMFLRIVLPLLVLTVSAATAGPFQELPQQKIQKAFKTLTVSIEPAPADTPAAKKQEYSDYLPIFLKELEAQAGNFDQNCEWLMNLGLTKRPSGSYVVTVALEQKFTQKEREAAREKGVKLQPSERDIALITRERFGESFQEMIKTDITNITRYGQCKKF
jgi:hypothetical protein